MQTLEGQARRLLEEARARSGASVEKIVKALGQYQPRRAATRRSWYDWQEKPETVSLLTGLAAIHLLGPEATTELLFGDTSSDEERGLGASREDLDHLRNELADMVTQLMQLRERVEGLVVPELENQAKLMAKLLGDMKEAGILSGADAQESRTGSQRTESGS